MHQPHKIGNHLFSQALSVPPVEKYHRPLRGAIPFRNLLQWSLFFNRLPGKYSTSQDI
jgi:hypothetical protein